MTDAQCNYPLWKWRIRDLFDYHEGALGVIDDKLKKSESLCSTAEDSEIIEHKARFDLYLKANSYVKSVIEITVTDVVYQKIMDKETACDVW